jgi:hypothetical protein
LGRDDIFLIPIALETKCEFSAASLDDAIVEVENSLVVVRARYEAEIMNNMLGASQESCIYVGTKQDEKARYSLCVCTFD